MSHYVPSDGLFVIIFSKTMFKKTNAIFCFCDVWNNQGWGTPGGLYSVIVISQGWTHLTVIVYNNILSR